MVDEDDDIFQVNSTDIEEALELLESLNLIYKQSGNLYNLTEKGQILVTNVSVKEYNRICFDILRRKGLEADKDYKKICDMNIDYKEISKN